MDNKQFVVIEKGKEPKTLNSKSFIEVTISMVEDYKEKVYGSENKNETIKEYDDILATLEKGISESSIETALNFYKKYVPLVEIKIID